MFFVYVKNIERINFPFKCIRIIDGYDLIKIKNKLKIVETKELFKYNEY